MGCADVLFFCQLGYGAQAAEELGAAQRDLGEGEQPRALSV